MAGGASTVEHPASFVLPVIPIATDLRSAIQAVNAIRISVQMIAGQLGTIPRNPVTGLNASGS